MFIDVAFLIFVVIAIFKGLSKGFVVGIFSLLAFIIGLAAALKLSVIVAHGLEGKVGSFSRWLPILSFSLVFIVVVLLVGMGARIIRRTLKIAMLGWLDKLAGIMLYLVLYSIIFSIILFFAAKTSLLSAETIQSSVTYPYLSQLGPAVINNLGKIIPLFKNLFGELQDFFGKAGNKLSG